MGAGLDIERWERGDYPLWLMAKAIAFYRGKIAIHNHSEDAVAIEMDKRSKKKGR